MKKLIKIKNVSSRYILLGICLLGLVVRFWWFPKNVYFGFDQSRDAFISQGIFINKDPKIIGPSAGKEGLYHGPLYWYLIGPLYLLFQGDPKFVLAFISLINLSGIFLVYYLGNELFGGISGLMAAFFYAFSFPQTQYSLYFANPAPAILTITLYYLGWTLLLIKKKPWAWILIGLGWGLSVQFEFFLVYLGVAIFLFLTIFLKDFRKVFRWKFFLIGIGSLLLSLSSFIFAEIKYNFRTTGTLLKILLAIGKPETGIKIPVSTFLIRLEDDLGYQVLNLPQKYLIFLLEGLVILFSICFYLDKKKRKELSVILIWIGSNLFVDLFGAPSLYYVNIGISVALILFLSYLTGKLLILGKYGKIYVLTFVLIIVLSNVSLIKKYNISGPIKSLYVQDKMLLEDEKKVLDLIYKDSNGKKFTFYALTMPYKIKTTWAYLFNWYGKKKYNYVPFWGGENVPGYPGQMLYSQSHQYLRYSVFEPLRGIPDFLQKEFTDNENGYGLPVFREKIGGFTVEKRVQ